MKKLVEKINFNTMKYCNILDFKIIGGGNPDGLVFIVSHDMAVYWTRVQ